MGEPGDEKIKKTESWSLRGLTKADDLYQANFLISTSLYILFAGGNGTEPAESYCSMGQS